jgi:glycosyltransferase involved in cell wall biosynthesis
MSAPCEPVTSALWAVLPGGIDNPAAPSGGNRYDRTVLTLLASPTHPAPPTTAHPAPPTTAHPAPPTTAHPEPLDALAGAPAVPPPAAPQSPLGSRPPHAAVLRAREVHEIAIDGDWPVPDDRVRAKLDCALADIPDGSDVLLDGLVACGVPEVLRPHARRLRLAVLVHLPLSDETGLSAAQARRLRALERETLHLATTVIATSYQAARHLSAMHGTSSVAVAAPGVHPAPLATPTATGRRLLCVASVTPRKGQDLLVATLQERLADLDWECTFVGALARPVPCTHPNIRFTGPLAGSDLDAAYANADLFVLPSRAETYGMVVTEALARGLPVIATAVGGVPEALGATPNGDLPGALVPPDDPAALAAATRAWLTDPALRTRWRAAARIRRAGLPTWAETAWRLNAALTGT